MYWEICKKLESTECAIELQKDIILDTIVINIKKKKNETKSYLQGIHLFIYQ